MSVLMLLLLLVFSALICMPKAVEVLSRRSTKSASSSSLPARPSMSLATCKFVIFLPPMLTVPSWSFSASVIMMQSPQRNHRSIHLRLHKAVNYMTILSQSFHVSIAIFLSASADLVCRLLTHLQFRICVFFQVKCKTPKADGQSTRAPKPPTDPNHVVRRSTSRQRLYQRPSSPTFESRGRAMSVHDGQLLTTVISQQSNTLHLHSHRVCESLCGNNSTS